MYTDIMRAAAVLACVVAATVAVSAQRRGAAPAAPTSVRETPKFACPAVAGVGVNTKRRYCDVKIAEIVEDGIRVELPPRTGALTLQFDLHNRLTVSGRNIAPSRQDALIAIVDPQGKIVERGMVRAELRTEKDLFDRLAPVTGRSLLPVAPGQPERIRVTAPAGAAFLSIVGLQLDVQLPTQAQRHENPGRAIALASGFEIAYTRARPR